MNHSTHPSASADPDALLLAFLESTYEAVATIAAWDRDTIERPNGPSIPGARNQ
jgi:hypothetical protein